MSRPGDFWGVDLYPTNAPTRARMLDGIDWHGARVWEPEAGRGDLVQDLIGRGAEVIATEIDERLVKILHTFCKVIGSDMLQTKSEEISHVQYIVMNPPFSKAAEHIAHAYEIAPAGCHIIALANAETVRNPYSKSRQQVTELINQYGQSEEIGDCFKDADRQTNVEVVLIRLRKPGEASNEFEGFFMDEDPTEDQYNGIMPYNAVRDLVNRYVESIRIFDQQAETAIRLNELQAGYFNGGLPDISVSFTRLNAPVHRNDFKKEMQRQGWQFIFAKMDMAKYATRGLREDINKFVETQTNIPFTMRNIYKMLEVVIGTAGSRMDKALLEVFDKVTLHHHENRHGVEGWQTNSNYLLTKRFIMPSVFEWDKRWPSETVSPNYSGFDTLTDLTKALCYLTGKDYDEQPSLYQHYRNNKVAWGDWVEIHGSKEIKTPDGLKVEIVPGFFKIKAFKKGTAHIEFIDEKVWSAFNARIAQLRGYPLYEKKDSTKWQRERATGKREKTYTVLETIAI